MFNNIVSFLPTNIPWLCVLIVSMLPMFEIRGAIPFGLSGAVFGESTLQLWQVCLLSFAGASVLALVVLSILKLTIFLLRKNKKLGRHYNNFLNFLDKKFFKYKNSVNTKKWWVVSLFTAIPFPFSGVWSACLLSVFLNMRFVPAFFSIVFGNLLTTLIVSLFCTVFCEFADLVFVVFVLITLFVLFYCALKLFIGFLNRIHANKNKICK